jgi:hypothetical protein
MSEHASTRPWFRGRLMNCVRLFGRRRLSVMLCGMLSLFSDQQSKKKKLTPSLMLLSKLICSVIRLLLRAMHVPTWVVRSPRFRGTNASEYKQAHFDGRYNSRRALAAANRVARQAADERTRGASAASSR